MFPYNELNFIKHNLLVMTERTPASVFLKPRHIDLLLSLDRTRHLGQTAAALHMSQPAASKSLAQLETQVGYTLFERTGTGTVPTALGEMVVAHARNLAGAAERMATALQVQHSQHRRLLHVGILPSAAIHIVPRLVSALIERDAELEITIHEGLLHELIDSLQAGRLDCVIGRTTSRIDATQIEGMFLYEDPIALVCGVGNPLARQAAVSVAELETAMWILPVRTSVLNDRMDEMFARLGMTRPARHVQSNAILANLTLINQHPWVTALPRVIAEHFQRQGSVHILPVDTRINFGNVQMLTRKDPVHTPPLRLVIETLRALFGRAPQA